MKSLLDIIQEKLILTKYNHSKEYSNHYYKLMKKLLWYARNIGHIASICNSFDELFRDNKGLKQFCIDYINNHPDHPEMLGDTTREIVGYFRSFKANEFDQYINEKLIISKNPHTNIKKFFPETEIQLKKIIDEKISSNYKIIDVSDIDISKVNTLTQLFKDCKSLVEIRGLHTWDTTNVESFAEMFYNCINLTSIDISNWNVNNCFNFRGMFQNCYKLNDIGDVSDWELFTNSSSVDMSTMFGNCKSLQSIDISKWNLSGVYWFSNVFTNCENLESVGDLTNLKFDKVYSFAGLFHGCTKLQNIGDISNWNIKNSKHMPLMFMGCVSLYSIGNIGKWDVSHVLDIESMFEDCKHLKLDISNWKLSPRCRTTNAFKYTDRKIFKKCKIK